MQRKQKSLLITASLIMTGSLLFYACGDGPVDIIGDYTSEIDASNLVLGVKIKNGDDSIWTGTDPLIEPSSSSKLDEPPPPPSSSSSKAQEPEPPVSSEASSKSSSSSAPKSSSSVSSSSAQRSSNSSVTAGACKENNPKSGFDCKWDGYSANAILAPGKALKPAKATVPSGCTVAWKYAPDTTGIAVNNFCYSVDENDGIEVEGSQTYVLFAVLTCSDGTHTNACEPKKGWSSKIAPKLQGECEWDKNPISAKRGATPSGITLSDPDKVCGSEKIVYKYDDGSKTWPTGEVPAGTYKDVQATINCPGVIPITCPSLEAKAGSDHIIECTCPGNKQCQIDEKVCKVDGKAGKDVTLNVDECVDVTVYGYDNQYYLPKVGMRCQSNGANYTVKINGKTTPGTNDLLILGTMKLQEENDFGTFCLMSLSGNNAPSSIKCNINGE